MNNNRDNQKKANNLPIAKNEDVEFAMDEADQADLDALARAEAADARQENS
ncbi:YfhD family protein [Paenibacillus guangzhouensis]|uniref:YfhD family protein n=1 Tax=Paenibacillus guangzhouensis TaxID=1473112 RepID=UPI001266AB36|nr:YfhD family protein [Paenibacillus guangzhouensis]